MINIHWSDGNKKLGAIVNFSIPAIKTCPGSTEFCRNICYADKGFFTFQQKRYQENYIISKRKDFAEIAIKDLNTINPKIVRIHVAGDFYDKEYIEKWIKIISALPKINFYVYTRSWRLPELRPSIRLLCQLNNIHLWYSLDKETGLP